MKNKSTILALLLLLAGCESLKDTYSDYTGDGVIRYVGKCLDVSVKPGWKRLIVNWTNSPDPIVDNIKVKWSKDGLQDSAILASGVTEYSIDDLDDGNYEVIVCSVDADGNESLYTPLFMRPYTSAHEVILSFTRLVSRHYFIHDRLVLYFSSWTDKIESATLTYYSSGGRVENLELTSSLIEERYFLIPDAIDTDKPVTLKRSGWVEGCEDLIVFDPYVFSHDKLYSSDFKHLIRSKYGVTTITDAFASGLTELEFDYTINSFEDILNLPNLKKLILGGNRFQKEEYLDPSVSSYASHSEVEEMENSLFALEVANEVLGLTVERYNQHYFPDMTLPYMTEMGNPVKPSISYLTTDDWKISCTPEDEGIYNSYVEHLIDGNLTNFWQPEYLSSARTHEIIIDMHEMKTVNGVMIAQKDFNPGDDIFSGELLPAIIKVKISADGYTWEDATFVEENKIGATAAEQTILYLPSPKEGRYIKVIVNDQPIGQNFTVTLAELGIF